MTTLYFDCFAGASGDMILGALIDAGVPLDEVRDAIGSLAIDRETLWTERVVRAGISATKFQVAGEDDQHAHARAHAEVPSVGAGDDGRRFSGVRVHEHVLSDGERLSHAHAVQTHRTLEEIGDLIERSSLSPAGRERARALFQRLGEVEAAIHGVPPDQVQLHEVGALDSIIDIVGTVFAMERLRVDRVVSSPLHVGSGHVRTAHGVFPVPAPATLALLRGAPISSGPEAAEMVTPTGALLVTGYAESYGTLPAMRVRQVGYGAGAREFADTPNVLRVVIGEDDLPAQVETVTVIEAEIDDMNPQFFGPAMERLLAAGALDVYYTPVQMKKNRPGVLLTIVADPDSREALTAIVFRETTTIGVRYRDSRRERLERERHLVTTPFGDVHVKVARRGSEMINAQPEFEDCVRVAAASGRVIKDVHAAAMKAFLDQTS